MARKTATMDARPAEHGVKDRLPAGPALFTGRRSELAALAAAAARPVRGRSPVVVLAGRPGSGRTTLAVRFVRSVAQDYPDGVLFTRLSAPDGSRVPPGQVARRLLEQLGPVPDAVLVPGSGDGADDPACGALRKAQAGRRLLFLLDDVRDAGQLWPLLADEPGCLLVATTAGPLTGIEDIDPVILGGLDQSSAGDLLSGLVGGTRISCDPVGAADLAEACGARPAALRLMAGWLRTNPKAAVTEAARVLAAAGPALGTGTVAGGGIPAGQGGAGADGRTGQGEVAAPDQVGAPAEGEGRGTPRRGAPAGRIGLPGRAGGGLSRQGAEQQTGPAQGRSSAGAAEAVRRGVGEGAGGADGRQRTGTGLSVQDTGQQGAGRIHGQARAGAGGARTDRSSAGAGGEAGRAAARVNGQRSSAERSDGVGAQSAAGERTTVPGKQRGAQDAEAAAQGPVPVPDTDPLSAAFTLLYRSLPAAQARMLRMLTLAPAQLADLRTASALIGCPAPEAEAILRQLAERELLDEEPPAVDGTPRYRVPGRLFVRLVRLRDTVDRPSEVQLARARMLERLVRLVDSARLLMDPAAPAVTDPLPGAIRLRTAAQAADWLLGERELLFGAVAEAIGQADLDGSAGRLVTALLRALPLTGAAAPADLYQLHGLVLKVAERGGATRRAAAALLNLGGLQAAAGRWEQAAARYRAALDHARTAADEPACARALEGVGECHRALGDPVRAADWYGRALALRRSLGDRPAEARLLARTAEAHAGQRRFEEADREYRAALALLRRLGDERGRTVVAGALDSLRQQAGDGWDRPSRE
ncbi:tetratricopeptide repeat protein [Kitasatospora sp. GP82]|uniref:tetratricopeptide repeat protein n=1 Tax=Kitasatospora sp. GP82 TaxID=3035089 RepID=UPI002475C62C|nr:tetratricopeptide repeat protein [Kitasatospora sp. GP82]MDH6128477.1 tetratricopeptide (TPR) repeat protein [Kitasatospora sp. GP82]